MESRRIPGDPRQAVAGPASERTTCVLAPNPSPMTLDGTNTWLIAEPDSDLAVVVDPGPDDEGHLQAVVKAVEAQGRRVGLTVLTHGHDDHSGGARSFASLTGAPVRALDPQHRYGDEGLTGGDVIRTGGLELRVMATPGHSWDSLCFALPADRLVLTGDTVLGRGTTVVAHPDGKLGEYLQSLEDLRALLAAGGDADLVLPAHGPVLEDGRGIVEFYLEHRAKRLDQVREAVALGDTTAGEVVERVYANVDRGLWWAAEMSVRAQLEYLRQE